MFVIFRYASYNLVIAKVFHFYLIQKTKALQLKHMIYMCSIAGVECRNYYKISRKCFFTGRVPKNKSYPTGTVPENKNYPTGTLINKLTILRSESVL